MKSHSRIKYFAYKTRGGGRPPEYDEDFEVSDVPRNEYQKSEFMATQTLHSLIFTGASQVKAKVGFL